jgi:hypothetical protein
MKNSAKKNNMQSPQEQNKNENIEKKTKLEKLTDKDIKELMGMNMRTYRRGKGGSIRQR